MSFFLREDERIWTPKGGGASLARRPGSTSVVLADAGSDTELTAGIFFVGSIFLQSGSVREMSHGHMTFTIFVCRKLIFLCKFQYCIFIQKDCEDLVAKS